MFKNNLNRDEILKKIFQKIKPDEDTFILPEPDEAETFTKGC